MYHKHCDFCNLSCFFSLSSGCWKAQQNLQPTSTTYPNLYLFHFVLFPCKLCQILFLKNSIDWQLFTVILSKAFWKLGSYVPPRLALLLPRIPPVLTSDVINAFNLIHSSGKKQFLKEGNLTQMTQGSLPWWNEYETRSWKRPFQSCHYLMSVVWYIIASLGLGASSEEKLNLIAKLLWL